jgi:hypothetical protein
VLSAPVTFIDAVRASTADLRGSANGHLSVTELEVPPGADVEGRLEYYYDSCGAAPPSPVPAGVVRMPVFSRLVPAGEKQPHYLTDLGPQSVRRSVAIYNAGLGPAFARISIRRPHYIGESPLIQLAPIPADMLVQIPAATLPTCEAATATSPWWVTVTDVTVDQPGFSFVTTLRNGKTDVGTIVSP